MPRPWLWVCFAIFAVVMELIYRATHALVAAYGPLIVIPMLAIALYTPISLIAEKAAIDGRGQGPADRTARRCTDARRARRAALDRISVGVLAIYFIP